MSGGTPAPDDVAELLPCPFCGSHDVDPTGWASATRKGPCCEGCGATADSVDAWNRRAVSSDALAIMEAMGKALEPFAAASIGLSPSKGWFRGLFTADRHLFDREALANAFRALAEFRAVQQFGLSSRTAEERRRVAESAWKWARKLTHREEARDGG